MKQLVSSLIRLLQRSVQAFRDHWQRVEEEKRIKMNVLTKVLQEEIDHLRSENESLLRIVEELRVDNNKLMTMIFEGKSGAYQEPLRGIKGWRNIIKNKLTEEEKESDEFWNKNVD